MRRKALVYFTSKDAIELFGGNEGRQLLDYITKQDYCSREYLVDGTWCSQPKGMVSSSRYNVSRIFTEIVDVAEAWKYIKKRSIQQPEKADKILGQLAIARLKPEKLRVFSPWGPRYNRNSPRIEETDPEIATLKELKEIFRQFARNGYNIDFLLMPADAYGTEVNNLSQDFVMDYFKWLEDWTYKKLGKEGVTVKLWSSIRSEQSKRYEELRRMIDQNLFDCIKEGEYRNAVKVARVFNPSRAEESARRYCIERLVEGSIIAERYDPIKLSLVRKEKDALDGPLKRIYIVRNKAPWLRGE